MHAVGRRWEAEAHRVVVDDGRTGGVVAIDAEVAGAHTRKQDAAAEADRHARDLVADVRSRCRIRRGHLERRQAARRTLDGDRVFTQVGLAGAHDLHPVAAGSQCSPVDDVVAAIGGIAGRGGDQVAICVVEIDRGLEIVDELLAVGTRSTRRGRREDQVIARVDVERVPVAADTAQAVAGQARGRVGVRGSDPLKEGEGVRIVLIEEVVAGTVAAVGIGDDQFPVGVGDVLLVEALVVVFSFLDHGAGRGIDLVQIADATSLPHGQEDAAVRVAGQTDQAGVADSRRESRDISEGGGVEDVDRVVSDIEAIQIPVEIRETGVEITIGRRKGTNHGAGAIQLIDRAGAAITIAVVRVGPVGRHVLAEQVEAVTVRAGDRAAECAGHRVGLIDFGKGIGLQVEGLEAAAALDDGAQDHVGPVERLGFGEGTAMSGEVGVLGHDQAVVGPRGACNLGVIPARGRGDEVVDGFGRGAADRLTRCIRPVEDGRDGGQSTIAASEADVCGRAAHDRGDVHGVGLRGRRGGCEIRDRDVQRRAVIAHRDVHRIAAADVHPGAGQVDGRNGRRRTIRVEARRIGPFAGIVVIVELDGDAVGHRLVTETAATCPQGVRIVALDREREAVGRRIGDGRHLEIEAGLESGDIERVVREGAARLTEAPVGQIEV